MDAIDLLLKPRSVAVIGASSDLTKTSGRPLAYLKKYNYKGHIYPVNPNASEIAGVPCFPDIASIPNAPDVAIVMLGAERAISAVRALATIGTTAAIVLASGYAELGEKGAKRQEELKLAAGPMRLLGPNTIGLINVTDNIPLSASSALEVDFPPKGNIALVSQSGGILGSLLSRAAAQNIGFSKLISTSNEADLDLTDFTQALINDNATHVIALYMETLRNPERFRTVARKAREAGKPLVVFKVGRSEAGARSAVSHTGAMAGSDKMYEALFKEVGIIRVREFAELLSVPLGLSIKRQLRGKRIAILTSTGGAGTLIADSLGLAGFDTPAPDARTAEELRKIPDGEQSALDRNPIDVTLAGLEPKLLRSAIASLMRSDSYDAVVAIVGSSALAMPKLMADAIKDCLSINKKPIIAYVSPYAPHIISQLNALGIPAYAAPEACASVFTALLKMNQATIAVESTPKRHSPKGHTGDVLRETPSGPLNETQAKNIFAKFGIPTTREIIVSSPKEAQVAAKKLTGLVALKLLSNQVMHKTDIDGVMLNLHADTIAADLLRMQKAVHHRTGVAPQTFLVQEMITNGEELILGFVRDPLGSALLLGVGGTMAELLNDSVLTLQPLDRPLMRAEAASMVQELKSWPLLNGYRGKPLRDVEALISAIVGFSKMIDTLGPRLLEAEINPIIVKNSGDGVIAADGLIVLL